MTAGREVVEDYGTVGLTLRQHPIAFLRQDLLTRRIVSCADAMAARDGRWLTTAGLVLVRQKPGSAKGVLFITIEDESGIANLVIWPQVFEKQRRIVLTSGMLAVKGRVQREGEVVHVIAHELTDLSGLLRSVGEREAPFPLTHGRGDQVTHYGGGPDSRDRLGARARDIYSPELNSKAGIKVATRDFR
jgi:error-prone DNA polymerase